MPVHDSYTASGHVLYSGAGISQPSYDYLPVGGLTYSHSAIDRATYKWAASGSLAYSGAGLSKPHFAWKASGSIAYSQHAKETPSYKWKPSGAIAYSGAATVKHWVLYAYVASGKVLLSRVGFSSGFSSGFSVGYLGSSASEKATYAYNAGVAKLITTGHATATAGFHWLALPASIVLSKSGNAKPSYPFHASGILAFSGAAQPIKQGFNLLGSGGIAFDDEPDFDNDFNNDYGGAFPGASATEQATYKESGNGKVTSVGSAAVKTAYNARGSGSLAFGSKAIYQRAYDYIASGGLSYASQGIAKPKYPATSSGRLVLSGVATDKPSYRFVPIDSPANPFSSGFSKGFSSGFALQFTGKGILKTCYYKGSGGFVLSGAAVAKPAYQWRYGDYNLDFGTDYDDYAFGGIRFYSPPRAQFFGVTSVAPLFAGDIATTTPFASAIEVEPAYSGTISIGE
jgi:hypothetical protein